MTRPLLSLTQSQVSRYIGATYPSSFAPDLRSPQR